MRPRSDPRLVPYLAVATTAAVVFISKWFGWPFWAVAIGGIALVAGVVYVVFSRDHDARTASRRRCAPAVPSLYAPLPADARERDAALRADPATRRDRAWLGTQAALAAAGVILLAGWPSGIMGMLTPVLRLLTPPGIDFSSSGLGMATCVRPEVELARVLNPVQRRLCPGNALMGTGSARAELRLGHDSLESRFDGGAQLALYSGESVGDKPGLIVVANTYHPMRAQLTYRGYLYIPPPEFGLGMALQVPQIPRPPLGAPIALSSFRLVVGAAWMRYVRTRGGRSEEYHPRGVPLPVSCPPKGFHFRAIVRFGDADGRVIRKQADDWVACPAR